MRDRLIAATIQLVSTEGLPSVTVRRVSQMCDASTMAVYSNFHGMAGLIRAAGSEGFAQLSARMDEFGETDDPLSDLLVLGFVFRDEAQRRPGLFQLMFGSGLPKTDMRVRRGNVLTPGSSSDFEHYGENFNRVVKVAQRAQEAGLINTSNPRATAAEFWMGLYGFTQLEMAGHFGDRGVADVLMPSLTHILIGMGAPADRISEAITRTTQRILNPPS